MTLPLVEYFKAVWWLCHFGPRNPSRRKLCSHSGCTEKTLAFHRGKQTAVDHESQQNFVDLNVSRWCSRIFMRIQSWSFFESAKMYSKSSSIKCDRLHRHRVLERIEMLITVVILWEGRLVELDALSKCSKSHDHQQGVSRVVRVHVVHVLDVMWIQTAMDERGPKWRSRAF